VNTIYSTNRTEQWSHKWMINSFIYSQGDEPLLYNNWLHTICIYSKNNLSLRSLWSIYIYKWNEMKCVFFTIWWWLQQTLVLSKFSNELELCKLIQLYPAMWFTPLFFKRLLDIHYSLYSWLFRNAFIHYLSIVGYPISICRDPSRGLCFAGMLIYFRSGKF